MLYRRMLESEEYVCIFDYDKIGKMADFNRQI